MGKFLKVLLIALGIIVLAYGIYLIFGRPAIPLPAYRYKVSEGNQLYDFVKSTESDEVRITLVTNGEIIALADDISLATINYTPNSLNNTVSLASKYVIPTETQNKIAKINKYFPPIRFIPRIVEGFFYHVIRFRLTVVLDAN